MIDPTTIAPPPGGESALSDWMTKAGLVLGAAVGLLAVLRKFIPSLFGTIGDILDGQRRFADSKREGVLEAMQGELDGLKKIVSDQQAMLDNHQAVINGLRYDLSDARAYGWDAYGEIRRIDPDTAFPKPPRPRDEQQPHDG